MSKKEERGQRGVLIIGVILALGVGIKLIDIEIAHQFEKNSKKKGLYAVEKKAFKEKQGIAPNDALLRLMKAHPELFNPQPE